MSIRTEIEKSLDDAESLNENLNSFLSIEREYALRRAEELDESTDNPSFGSRDVRAADG